MNVFLLLFCIFLHSVSLTMESGGVCNKPVAVPPLFSLAKKAAVDLINSEAFLQAFLKNPKVLPVFGEKLEKEIITDIKSQTNGIIAKTIDNLLFKKLEDENYWWIASFYWNANSKRITSIDAGNNSFEWDVESARVVRTLDYDDRLKIIALMKSPVLGHYKPFYDHEALPEYVVSSQDRKWKAEIKSSRNIVIEKAETSTRYPLWLKTDEYIDQIACFSPDCQMLACKTPIGIVIFNIPMIERIPQLNLAELLELCSRNYSKVTAECNASQEKKSCIVL